jgi:hypothetical protein
LAKGRKRKKHVARTTSGRISRARSATEAAGRQVEAAAVSVAVEARARLYGLAAEAARDEKMGYPVGRLLRAGFISPEHHDIAMSYAKLANAYAAAIDAAGRVTDPRSEDDPPKACAECGRTDRCEPCQGESSTRIRGRWEYIDGLLSRHQVAVLRQVVIAQLDWPVATPHLVAALDIVGAGLAEDLRNRMTPLDRRRRMA